MDGTWIVSANASRARFFSQANVSEPWEEIHDMVNGAVRLRTAETEPDKIGPTAATKSQHNVGAATPNKAYQPNQTPTEHQTEVFARSVAAFLLQGYRDKCFAKLCLIASPEFLGVLRTLLDPQLQAVVRLEMNKDYTHLSPSQLREQIQAHKEVE